FMVIAMSLANCWFRSVSGAAGVSAARRAIASRYASVMAENIAQGPREAAQVAAAPLAPRRRSSYKQSSRSAGAIQAPSSALISKASFAAATARTAQGLRSLALQAVMLVDR